MSHDLQMARAQGDSWFNLAIGEPFFLQEALHPQLTLLNVKEKAPVYPTVGGESELVERLKELHKYRYVVVTNGAKQAIEAAFYAYRTTLKVLSVNHSTPYWPSYPTLATNQGLSFRDAVPREALVCVVTSPNNPDGSQPYLLKSAPDVWDAAYAHPVYGYDGTHPEVPHTVSVWSAAKRYGVSGLRVGWLCTNDQELAQAAAHFVEITTSGVSVPAQMRVAALVEAELESPVAMTNAYHEARQVLIQNGLTFMGTLLSHVHTVRGVPLDGSGMFAWFLAKDHYKWAAALQKAKVRLVTGDACGMYEKGWYRMSMGHRADYTRQALEALREALDG